MARQAENCGVWPTQKACPRCVSRTLCPQGRNARRKPRSVQRFEVSERYSSLYSSYSRPKVYRVERHEVSVCCSELLASGAASAALPRQICSNWCHPDTRYTHIDHPDHSGKQRSLRVIAVGHCGHFRQHGGWSRWRRLREARGKQFYDGELPGPKGCSHGFFARAGALSK